MKLKVKVLKFLAGKPVCMIHEKTAEDMSLHVGHRVSIEKGNKKIISVADTVSGRLKKEEIGVSDEIVKGLNLKAGNRVNIEITERPHSIELIKKKLKGQGLTKKEIEEIVKDVAKNALTEAEIAFFISAVDSKGMSLRETKNLIHAMVKSGSQLRLRGKVADKHCLPFDTPIMIQENGQIRLENIGDIVERVTLNKEEKEIKVLSWDDDYRIFFTPIISTYKINSPKKVIKIILKGNREITLTDKHTIFILDEGKVINLPSKEIKRGDYILVPNGFSCGVNNSDIQLIFDKENKKDRHINKEIKADKELMRFLGYYIAEGFINYQGIFLNFGSHEHDLIEDSINCIKKVFGISPTITKPHKTATRICIYSQELSKAFRKVFDFQDFAENKSIPPFIFKLNRDLIMEFVRALFKGDGYVRRGYEAIYVTVSNNLACQLSYLLSLIGASVSVSIKKEGTRYFPNNKNKISKTKKVYYLYTQAREIFGGRIKDNVAFVNLLPINKLGGIEKGEIGWKFRRELKNQKYITKQKLARIEKYILNEDVKKLIRCNLSVLEVKSVEIVDSDSEYVYDLKTENGRFIAGFMPVCIHNSIGGVAGNRTTPIIISICTTTGLIMPKTSSRAITSAAGTADTIETLAKVDFSIKQIKKIIKKTNACFVWGGTLGLAPADDKIIRVGGIVKIDPTSQLLASILSKKISVDSKYILIDIPYGKSAKVSKRKAEQLKYKFLYLGRKFDLKIEVILTDGSEPIGNGIGPVLEMRDVIKVLKRDRTRPLDLEKKSLMLAGKLLEMTGKAKKGQGEKLASEILDSGKAFEKFKQIIKIQKGKIKKLTPGKYTYTIRAKRNLRIKHINNKLINELARSAGCPEDKKAGIYLYKKKRDTAKKGEKLFIIHTTSEEKMEHAKNFYNKNKKEMIEFR